MSHTLEARHFYAHAVSQMSDTQLGLHTPRSSWCKVQVAEELRIRSAVFTAKPFTAYADKHLDMSVGQYAARYLDTSRGA